jgi:hypothetical protein
MFNVIPNKQQLKTMTKSTCCWHQYSTYIIKNNKPKVIEIIEEHYNHPLITLDIQKWNGKKMIRTQENQLNLDPKDSKMLVSFKISNNRQIHLFQMYGLLNYVVLNDKNNIELILPENINDSKIRFFLNAKDDSYQISFKNYGFEYTIYENAVNKIGLLVRRKGVLQQNIAVDYDSKTGSLKSLLTEKLDNLILNK